MPLKIKSGFTGSLFGPLKKKLHKYFEGIVKIQKCERGVKSPKSIEKPGKYKVFHKTNKNFFSYSLVCDQAISHQS